MNKELVTRQLILGAPNGHFTKIFNQNTQPNGRVSIRIECCIAADGSSRFPHAGRVKRISILLTPDRSVGIICCELPPIRLRPGRRGFHAGERSRGKIPEEMNPGVEKYMPGFPVKIGAITQENAPPDHLHAMTKSMTSSLKETSSAAPPSPVDSTAQSAPKTYIGDVGEVQRVAEIDRSRLQEYLRQNLPGYVGPLTIRQFQGGQSNLTYMLETPGTNYVLRRQPSGVLLKSAHAVDREFRVMTALAGVQDFPVPQTLVLCTDRTVLGSMFYVMSYVPGRIFWDCRMPDLSSADRAAIFDSANATLARLHSVDYAALGLGDYGKPGNYFARQISRWSRQFEESRTQDLPEMDKLMAWLPSALPSDDGLSSIIHGDYSFHNLLIHPKEPRVIGVLDWELSTLGHPLGDLMYHMMEWYRPPGVDARGTLSNADLKTLGIPTQEEYMQRYCERTGFAAQADLPFYRAFNLFRTAAILQGVAHRLQVGNAASANAAEIAANIGPLAKAAWRMANGD